MTQVLTLLTPDCVIQLSDRRVTRIRAGQPEEYDDLANKAIVYLQLAAFGYTGAAEVAGRTDRWITEVLAPTAGLGDALNALCESATAAFRGSALRSQSLTIVGAGWDPLPRGGFAPFYAIVSNVGFRAAPSLRGAAAPNRAVAYRFEATGPQRDTFDRWAIALQRGMSHLLHVAGQPLLQGREAILLRNLGRALNASAHPLALIRLLAEEMWRAAARNPRIGRSLMAVSLPRSAARRSGPIELVGGPPAPDRFSALYLPAPDVGPVYYMPNVAGAGTLFLDATVEPLG